MNLKLLRMVIALLGVVVVGLLAAPWFISEPDIQKSIAKDLTFIAAGLIVLAAIGFLVNMTDAKLKENSRRNRDGDQFENYSLFDAKVRAMHERAIKGLHIFPETHICKKKLLPMEMLLRAVDPDDIVVDCYGNHEEGFRTRFYGSLDAGTTWYELQVPSTPRDRKTLLKVALGLASVHEFANRCRMERREKVTGNGEPTVAEPFSWADAEHPAKREERSIFDMQLKG